MLQILNQGLLAVQVCTDLRLQKEINEETNKCLTTGISSKWKIDEKLSKRLGQSKVKCAELPNNMHYILYC